MIIKGVSMEKLFRVPEAASVLNIRPATLRRWIFDGKVAVVRVGSRAIRISSEEITRIVREGSSPQAVGR